MTPRQALVLTVTTAFFAAAAIPAWAQNCVTVEVHNVRPQQGHIFLAAFTEAETFGKKALLSLRVAAGDAVTSFELCGVAGDSVALTLFQDLDGDGKMGRNALGLPSEPWGSSGTPGVFGPSWDSAKVALNTGVSGSVIVVKLSQ